MRRVYEWVAISRRARAAAGLPHRLRGRLACPGYARPAAVDLMAIGRDPLRFAEAYSRHDVDIEGDFFAAPGFKNHPRGIRASWRDRFGAFAEALGAR